MPTSVIMPKLGMNMSDGTLVEWLKEDGESVLEGEPIAVVETDKISIEVDAEAAGVLHHVVAVGTVHPIGTSIGYILAAGESLPVAPSTTTPGPTSDRTSGGEGESTQSEPDQSADKSGRMPVSPVARRLAAQLNVDLSQVPASGARITRQDVQEFYDSRAQAEPMSSPVPPASTERKAIPLSPKRLVTAQRLVESLQTMAQLTLARTADVTALVQLRDLLCDQWQLPISYTTLLIRATALALRAHRRLNSQLDGTELILHENINIGVAVALEDELIVPVIKRADSLDLRQIHHLLGDLVERARANALTMNDISDGTFTLSNLGMYGVEVFTAIINPPQVAILGIGSIATSLALSEGQVVERRSMALSLSIDHRAVDGAPGAQFLQSLVGLLERPYSLL